MSLLLLKELIIIFLFGEYLFRLTILDPILIHISLFIGCLVETRNYSILSLAFIAIFLRVTEENLVFETVQSGPYPSLLLKDLTFIFYLLSLQPVLCCVAALKSSPVHRP